MPARVCDNCGEESIDETTTAELLLETADAVGHVVVQVNSPVLKHFDARGTDEREEFRGEAAVMAGSGDGPSRGRPSARRRRSRRRPGRDVTCYDARSVVTASCSPP